MVTEWTNELRPAWAIEFSSNRVSGVDDRAACNRETTTGSLERLAAVLEMPAG